MLGLWHLKKHNSNTTDNFFFINNYSFYQTCTFIRNYCDTNIKNIYPENNHQQKFTVITKVSPNKLLFTSAVEN